MTGKDRQRLLDVRRAIEAATDGRSASAAVARNVVDRLAEGFGAGVAMHRPELTATGWSTEQAFASDDPRMHHLIELHDRFLPTAPLRFGSFDPLLVEAAQRNRVLTNGEMRAIVEDSDPPAVVREVYRPGGVAELSHVRVLVTDGPFLLAWLGLWREQPFQPEEEELIASLVPRFAARLSVERLLWGGTPGSFDAVGQTLELVGRPAFVVNAAGQLVFVNAAARALIDHDRAIIDDVTETAVGTKAGKRIHSVTAVGAVGMQRHFIVLTAETSVAKGTRLDLVAQSHGLTETQARVLALLVRGDANKDIATKLRCAPRTVELHVTAILKKCHVESRARLIAWFWTSA